MQRPLFLGIVFIYFPHKGHNDAVWMDVLSTKCRPGFSFRVPVVVTFKQQKLFD